VVERGYRAIVVSVDLARRAMPFLGREFDADLVTDLSTIDDLDPCGEQGEYHTYVFDGPDFRSPVEFTVGETVDIEDHRFIDLVPIAAGAEAGRLGPT
jgi:diphthamide synthase (EF-2-diphthine--ammonia ligase)